MPVAASPVSIKVDPNHVVSGLLQVPDPGWACCVLAHGAGAGMIHLLVAALADGLGEQGIAALRFQFPSMEQGSKRPDPPTLAHATIRAAVAAAARLVPALPLFTGGKSFGGRMTSQARAAAPLQGARGKVFLGFPLHLAGKPSDDRARHLSAVRVPMPFLQGAPDALVGLPLPVPLVQGLEETSTLRLIEHVDHSCHVPHWTGRIHGQVLGEALDFMAGWMRGVLAGPD